MRIYSFTLLCITLSLSFLPVSVFSAADAAKICVVSNPARNHNRYKAAYIMNGVTYLIKDTGGIYVYNQWINNERVSDVAVINEIVTALVEAKQSDHLQLIADKLSKKNVHGDFADVLGKIKSIQRPAANQTPPENTPFQQSPPSHKPDSLQKISRDQLQLIVCHRAGNPLITVVESASSPSQARGDRGTLSPWKIAGGVVGTALAGLVADALVRKERSLLLRSIAKGKVWAIAVWRWILGRKNQLMLAEEDCVNVVRKLEEEKQ